MSSKIDLIYFSDSRPDWQFGQQINSEKSSRTLQQDIQQLITTTDSDWVLFWDYSLGEPDTELILSLADTPVDAWHAGLRFGLHYLPDALNYVHPTWMYNSNAPNDITHTNFRLSLSACMIRVSALRKLSIQIDAYTSLEMAGVALGYQLLKAGGIIRYHASLLKQDIVRNITAPDIDEWIFARQYFSRKWHWWVLYSRPGFSKNYNAWKETKAVTYINVQPVLHSSLKDDTPVKHSTVSVLAPTLDRYPYLKEELRELNEQTILPHEVLITDQTDKAHRQEIDFSIYPNLNVRYFPQDEKGQCLAWNKLIEESTGEYIFFFGDDAYDIKPDLIEKMLQTMQRFDADMVASHVREKGIKYGPVNYHYFLSDSFPITLIKKSVVLEAGGMDMFFNRNVRADHDLAMRCHMNGALMVFDSSALIGHHRAPSGGLRAHKARVVTNYMTKNTITKILNPTTSEIFIYKKYYTPHQYKNHIRIKYANQLVVNGNIIKKALRVFYFLFKIPSMKKAYRQNEKVVNEEFRKRGIKA